MARYWKKAQASLRNEAMQAKVPSWSVNSHLQSEQSEEEDDLGVVPDMERDLVSKERKSGGLVVQAERHQDMGPATAQEASSFPVRSVLSQASGDGACPAGGGLRGHAGGGPPGRLYGGADSQQSKGSEVVMNMVRETIVAQESTFVHQVHELHRLVEQQRAIWGYISGGSPKAGVSAQTAGEASQKSQEEQGSSKKRAPRVELNLEALPEEVGAEDDRSRQEGGALCSLSPPPGCKETEQGPAGPPAAKRLRVTGVDEREQGASGPASASHAAPSAGLGRPSAQENSWAPSCPWQGGAGLGQQPGPGPGPASAYMSFPNFQPLVGHLYFPAAGPDYHVAAGQLLAPAGLPFPTRPMPDCGFANYLPVDPVASSLWIPSWHQHHQQAQGGFLAGLDADAREVGKLHYPMAAPRDLQTPGRPHPPHPPSSRGLPGGTHAAPWLYPAYASRASGHPPASSTIGSGQESGGYLTGASSGTGGSQADLGGGGNGGRAGTSSWSHLPSGAAVSFPPTSLPSPSASRPPFKRPPPLVLLRDAGSREMRLVPAEERVILAAKEASDCGEQSVSSSPAREPGSKRQEGTIIRGKRARKAASAGDVREDGLVLECRQGREGGSGLGRPTGGVRDCGADLGACLRSADGLCDSGNEGVGADCAARVSSLALTPACAEDAEPAQGRAGKQGGGCGEVHSGVRMDTQQYGPEQQLAGSSSGSGKGPILPLKPHARRAEGLNLAILHKTCLSRGESYEGEKCKETRELMWRM